MRRRMATSAENTMESSNSVFEDDITKNPFKIPDDKTIFLIHNKEKERKKLEMQHQHSLRVHEKLTFAGKMKARQVSLRREIQEPQELSKSFSIIKIQDMPEWRAALIQDRSIERESIREYISKKREMFLMEYAMSVKRGQIRQLEEGAEAVERNLMQSEQYLEEDAALFDTFLKENDRTAVEAMKRAEQETKLKLEKLADIKSITAKIVAVKSDISKYEDILKEYASYRDFLMKLSPPEWQENQSSKLQKTSPEAEAKVKHPGKSQEGSRSSEMGRERASASERLQDGEKKMSAVGRELPPVRVPSRHSVKGTTASSKSTAVSVTSNASPEFEGEPDLYFTDPQQVLDLMTELEEQNLSLIQNSREAEEALEEYRSTMAQTQKRMELETEHLRQQIDKMTSAIQREKERAADLELKSRLFNFGRYKSDDQDQMLESLSQKVEEVYCCCVGDSESNLNTLQMLASIESCLGELLESVEKIPKEKILVAERAKERQRRVLLREVKIQQQKQQLEERMKRAQERAQAEVKKTTRRKLMARSQPPVPKLQVKQTTDITDQEREEHQYFFT
ncbi:cilia- and flagella-associated protein 100 [Denticeps clupeoides]|uniref:DUF4200 domain-containing protein n=1 Tax=Denticeps clupeoides TaxID=299321 RepID=A0AAY4E375_9TELE|nr:cilia- and flagella-associated protein 100-like [Denticeps clupeoides]